MSRILVVEDEIELAEVLCEYLKTEGFETKAAFDGKAALLEFHSFHPDLMVLDIMLPKLNGLEVLKEIRISSTIPVIMLSAKHGEMDKVICLGAGADDYVTKPFSAVELVARVKAQCRRYGLGPEKTPTTKALKHGRICLYEESYEAEFDGEKVELSTKEFELLQFFIKHVNHVFSKEQLYENIWGMNEYGEIGTVVVYIKKLRDKMSCYHMDYIKTVWGVGYKFIGEV